jgi:hypothetical protein
MLKERCYVFGSDPCSPQQAIHVFPLGARDADRCRCGAHQLGFYESRYIDVPVETEAAPENVPQTLKDLRRLDAALATLDSLRQSGYTITFNKYGVAVTPQGSLVVAARGEGTSADCLRQLAGQLK